MDISCTVNLSIEWIIAEGNDIPSYQNILLMPPKNPIGGPYWGAKTPIPLPLLISLTLSKTLMMSIRASMGQVPQIKLMLCPQIDLEVVWHMIRIGKSTPQAASDRWHRH